MSMTSMPSPERIAVIGGGAAGMLAAGTALALGADVTVFEHRDRTLLKLGITGKGRCNLTNNAPVSELIAAYNATQTASSLSMRSVRIHSRIRSKTISPVAAASGRI